jgi:murein DD-endopeptidase MepM/ murein hydrolase activator NlpD
MNGVFKFKENVFLKYKKEIILTVGAMLTLVTVVKFVPEGSDINETVLAKGSNSQVEEVVMANGYNVVLNGVTVGLVRTQEEGQAVTDQAFELAVTQLGYNPEVVPEVEFLENYSLEEDYTDQTELATVISDTFIAGLDRLKVKAYVMKIGDTFTVALSSEDEIKDVLKRAQSIYVKSDMLLDINLGRDEHNSLIIKPSVIMLKEDGLNRTFTASTAEANIPEAITEVQPKEEEKNIETIAIDFAEKVLVVEAYVFENEVLSSDEATALITKENEEAKVYIVAKGDVPSAIAEKNGMGLSDLYKLNPDLEANEKKIKPGDELIIMVPEPELSIATKDEIVYTEPIKRTVVYQDNPDKYVGKESVVDEGSDGVMEVTVVLSKINGEEVSREIINQNVITEAKDKIVSKGTKPVPKKVATGKYKYPLSSYRITSPFGPRWGSFHSGVDLSTPTGNTVSASDGGVVTIAGWYGNYGYLVEIDHGNGVTTRYGHNSKVLVSVGQKVAQNETIAKSGSTGRSTGPHVHFEIRFDGVASNPMKYLSK